MFWTDRLRTRQHRRTSHAYGIALLTRFAEKSNRSKLSMLIVPAFSAGLDGGHLSDTE